MVGGSSIRLVKIADFAVNIKSEMNKFASDHLRSIDLVGRMPLENQTLLVGVPGDQMTRDFAALCRRVQPGGFVLFSRNIRSAVKLRQLVDDLRDLMRIEPIITLDQEGGRVARLSQIGEQPPSAQQLIARNDSALIHRYGTLTGRLLRLFGFNLDLAPVLDLSISEATDNALRGRCFGSSPEQVSNMAGAFNDGIRSEGVASCGKHFPGYAFAQVDPHHRLPRIDRTFDELLHFEWQPYEQLVGRLDSVMTCHAWYPQLDAEAIPASLSSRIIQGVLRERLVYKGLILTDDLDMGALLASYTLEQSLHMALAAGNDMLMVCHRLDQLDLAASAMRRAPRSQLDRALEQIHGFKSKLKPPADFSESAFESMDREIWDLRVEVLGEVAARLRNTEVGKRSPVEEF